MNFVHAVQAAPPEKDTLKLVVGCFAVLLTLALMIGLVITSVRMRRPAANRKCHLSYIFFTTGWLLYAGIAALATQAGKQILGTIVGLIIFAVLGFSGIVMAILGMSEVRRSPERGTEGKSTAVTTLVLASLIVAGIASLFGIGFMRGIRMGLEERASIIGTPGEMVVVEDRRFSIQPSASWLRIANANPLASVSYKRARPEAYFMIIAEKISPDLEFDLQVLADNVVGHLDEAADEVKVIDQADEVINGLKGRRIICEASLKGTALTYLYWLHVSPDHCYQLIATGSRREAAAVLAECRKAFDSFTLLQPKK